MAVHHGPPGFVWISVFFLSVLVHVTPCWGKIELQVSPYPARVYTLSPADVPVLTVTGFDDVTGEPVSSFRLGNRNDASYFKISSDGVLTTASTINFSVGRTLEFFVFGLSDDETHVTLSDSGGRGLADTVEYKHVKILVSERNQFPPVFRNGTYRFTAYRYGVADIIGQVAAVDSDLQDYNQDFTILAAPDQPALEYISLEPSGVLRLSKPVPDTIETLDLKVMAVDLGAPRMTGTTDVTVDILMVRQPDVFCFSTTPTSTTICWKNPMAETPFEGYTLTVSGAVQRGDFIPAVIGHLEACYTLNDTQIGASYIFKVLVQSDQAWFGQELDIVFNKAGVGYSRDCVDFAFSWCSYRQPCHTHGTCVPSPTTSLVDQYTCQCDPGWRGDNCSMEDLCESTPCQHDGRCIFSGHQRFSCECVEGFTGEKCEHVDVCGQDDPCLNLGLCEMLQTGDYKCTCPTGYSGTHCELADPCSPFPCTPERSECTRLSDTEHSCDCFTGYYGDQCQHTDACALVASPCKNQGTCVTQGDSFTCSCKANYIGDQCETFDLCSIEPCQNGGTCSMQSANYACECRQGYSGGECQHRDPCHDLVCQHGHCESTQGCVCDEGYYGDLCQHYDVCLFNPCDGRGSCSSHTNSNNNDNNDSDSINKTEFTCECSPQWYGSTCEHDNLCYDQPCQNGGTCSNVSPGQFQCECRPAYSLADCSLYDPCHAHSCQHGTCLAHNSTHHTCQCSAGWLGPTCGTENPCYGDNNPCQNEAECVVVTDYADPARPLEEVYTAQCECVQGFLGRFCEFDNPCRPETSPPCVHGTCVLVDFSQWPTSDLSGGAGGQPPYPSTLEDVYSCDCDLFYTGPRCDELHDPCDNIQCSNGGDCVNGTCECPPQFTGVVCETQVCQASDTPTQVCTCEGDTRTCTQYCLRSTLPVQFPGTPLVSTRFPAGFSESLCSVACDNISDSGACERRTVTCMDNNSWHLSQPQDAHTCIQSLPVTQNALAQLTYMVEGSQDPASLSADTVRQFAGTLISLREPVLTNTTYANLALTVVGNLAQVKPNVSEQLASSGDNTNKQLRDFVDSYTSDVDLPSEGRLAVGQGSEVTVEVVAMPTALAEDQVEYKPFHNDNGVYIKLPKRKLETLSSSRIRFIAYNRSQLFVPSGGFSNVALLPLQAVISATVGEGQGEGETNFTDSPVEIRLKRLNTARPHSCVYWDETVSEWSTEGVTVVEGRDPGYITCTSTHLTSFAVLLSSTGDPISAGHAEALTFITYIGCGISMAALLLTIVTYGLFKVLHQEKSGKILLHLCVALLALNIVFLVGSVEVYDFSTPACVSVALLMHVLVLASLLWMLMEAVQMYQALVTVFTSYQRLYMTRRCLIAWGLPLVIVGIAAGVDISSYENPKEDREVCYLTNRHKSTYYGALVGPACLIVLINTVIFIVLSKVILTPRFQQQMKSEDSDFTVTPAQIRGAFCVMCLLGVTWIFGPLAIGEAKLVFSYLFCIFNSLQGFLIFIFRCLLNPEAKLAWIQLFTTGTLKRRRGPIKSVYTSDSSTGKDSHGRRYSNNSGPTTTNTIMSTTNGGTGGKGDNAGLGGTVLQPHQMLITSSSSLRRADPHVTFAPDQAKPTNGGSREASPSLKPPGTKDELTQF